MFYVTTLQGCRKKERLIFCSKFSVKSEFLSVRGDHIAPRHRRISEEK